MLPARLEVYLAQRRTAELFRQRQPFNQIDSTHLSLDGRRLVNFASNNYLGLTHHPRLIDAARRALVDHGAGSGAAGLVSGYSPLHQSAERAIATWKGSESAILVPSGYQANLAAIQTLATIGPQPTDKSAEASLADGAPGGVRFLVDKLIHASLLDALHITAAPFRVFPHNGLAKLRRLLCEAPARQMQVVLTESIFSMDGDAADLRALVELKREFGFVLVLDEAHASGVYGPSGSGLANEMGLPGVADVTIVTLSKALGGFGGAVCASANFIAALVNSSRAYIYSTSVPATMPATVLAALKVLADEPDRQRRLRKLAVEVRRRLADQGWKIPAGDSPIVPIICGDASDALALAEKLFAGGLYVPAIRPPTVPRGSSRLRITLSSDHEDGEIDLLLSELKRAQE